MIQQIKKIFLLFFIGITFFNCNLEEDYVQKQNLNDKSGRFKIQKKKFDELVTDKNISSLIKNYPRKKEVKNKITSRTISSDENDFYIDTEQSIYIEDTESNYSSYTFTVYRTETENSNYLENLVLSFPDDGYYQLTLIRYELTTQEKQDLESGLNIDLSDNIITTTSIEDSDFGAELSNKILLVQNGDCFTLIETSCSEGNHTDGYSNGSECPAYHEEEIWTFCNGPGGGGDDSSNSSGSDTSGGYDNGGSIDTGGGGGGSGSSGDTTDDNSGNDDGLIDPPDICKTCEIITSPLPELEDTLIDNPCDKIKNGTNSVAYKQKFKELNTPAHLNDSIESGFGQVGNDYIDGTPSSDHTIRYPNNSKNGTHVHNNNPAYYPNTTISYDKTIKMLSPKDIEESLIPMQNNNVDPKDTFVNMLSNEGIFAITILEPIIDNVALKLKLDKFASYYIDKVKYLVDNYTDMDSISRKEKLEKIFLLGLKKVNLQDEIGLFEGVIENENAADINNYRINWTRKTLKKALLGHTVESTPCN